MILSIESSCDDSSIAVTDIESGRLLFHKKISQELEHNRYGGVVPELASRLHVEALPKILEEFRPYFSELKAIAVTNEPGLAVTLIEGVTMAKGLSVALNIPIIGVHHLKGHIYSLFINSSTQFPMSILLVSGGHTQILEAKSFFNIKVVASTMDDSFGESFDKVAKMLSLSYPGGPVIEAKAKLGDENRFTFPIPLSQSPKIAFSYSGLKNAVRLQISKLEELSEQDVCDVAASFQKAAVAHLVMKSRKYFKKSPPKKLAIVGGASANEYLRTAFEKLSLEYRVPLVLAPLEFCSDNAAMIGRYGVDAYKEGIIEDGLNIEINPKSSLA